MQRVLVIERRTILGDMMKESLGDRFFVETCERETAMESVISVEPDILVIDIYFPVTNELKVIQAVRSVYPTTKVIVLATVMDESTVRKLVELDIFSFLPKPCPGGLVASKIQEASFVLGCPDDTDWCLENEIDRMLMDLGFRMGSNRYECVFKAILTKYTDSASPMKGLYIDVARLCGGNPRRVEKAIRDAISDAYECSDKTYWQCYFSLNTKRDKPYPGNEEFVARLVGYLNARKRYKKPCRRQERQPDMAECAAIIAEPDHL